MRYKKRYILACIDTLHGYSDYKAIVKRIRDAYAERFGREELEHARISLVYSKGRYKGYSEDRKKGEEGGGSIQLSSITIGKGLEYDARESPSNGRVMLTQIIIRCALEHYANVMHILSILGIRTLKTSGTLKALRRSYADKTGQDRGRYHKGRIIRVKE